MKNMFELLLEAVSEINFSPPEGVRAACKRGLELKKDHGGSGLTGAAVAWARKLANGSPISKEKAKKMNAYFARHIVDKKPGWDSPPTPGYVAWLLWGGNAGKAWSAKLCKQIDSRAKNEAKKKTPQWKKKGYVGPGGAMATAKRQAAKQGKKNNKAYISAIYKNMAGK